MKAKENIKTEYDLRKARLDLQEARNVLRSVAQMRQAQVEYFKSKDRDVLIEAKKLEAAVDMRLATMGIKAV